MTTLSEISIALTTALTEESRAQEALETAEAKLEPLRRTAKEKHDAVDLLINQRMGMLAPATIVKRRGRKPADPNAPKRTYNIDPEVKVAKAKKTAETRARNAGKTAKEIAKAGRDAEIVTREKLGLT